MGQPSRERRLDATSASILLSLALVAAGSVASCAEGGEVLTDQKQPQGTGSSGQGAGGPGAGAGTPGSGAAGGCVPSDEKCNGIDDDCDELIDEEEPAVLCADPNAHGVVTWSCDGTCVAEECIDGMGDVNADPADGCECELDPHATDCSMAATTDVPAAGQMTWTGVVETADGSDWMTFAFTVGDPSSPYHQKIELTDTAAGAYAMDVMLDCASMPMGCSTTGTENDETASKITVWEQSFTAYMAGAGCCTDATPRLVAVKVRVYRANGDQPACAAYTVTASSM